MRIDKIIIWSFITLVTVGISLLLFVRWNAETTELNMKDGSMRVVSVLFGQQYRSESIDSNLRWLEQIPDASREDRWVPISVIESSLVDRNGVFGKRVGLVYLDAITIAYGTRSGTELTRIVNQIRAADYAKIWEIRSGLREEYSKGHK